MPLTRIESAAIADTRGVNFRNIIINGDMSVAQRGTSETGITSTGYHTVDRFRTAMSSLGTFTQSQDSDVPSGKGFATSLKMDCTIADASPAAGDYLIFQQLFEGQNLQYLKKGTANAESLTLSFWVKSSKTGTYIVEFYDYNNTRSISKSYTINTTDTWEKKTITFAGDTTGALNNDNAKTFECNFWLGAGSTYTSGTLQTSWGSQTNANRAVGQVNLADSTDNDWYITGVQLEAGISESDFEFLPVDVNLQRCKRYYNELISSGNNVFFHMISDSGTFRRQSFSLNPRMRATPTVTITGDTSGTFASGSPTTESATDNKMLLLKGDVVSSTGTYSYIQNLIADAEL